MRACGDIPLIYYTYSPGGLLNNNTYVLLLLLLNIFCIHPYPTYNYTHTPTYTYTNCYSQVPPAYTHTPYLYPTPPLQYKFPQHTMKPVAGNNQATPQGQTLVIEESGKCVCVTTPHPYRASVLSWAYGTIIAYL